MKETRITRRLDITGQEASELLSRPLGCRVFCDIPMHDASRADLQHQEHVDETERSRDRDEEITRECLVGVVRTNVLQACDDEDGRGGVGRRMYRLTVRGETATPNFNSSSAAFRSSPQV